ncbi:hypothetical protein EDF70_11061 [Neorhizobium sp. JUb45]|nr:hypothetical protein EDF70_11061 [Neorhizobium sp. JUb45]
MESVSCGLSWFAGGGHDRHRATNIDFDARKLRHLLGSGTN